MSGTILWAGLKSGERYALAQGAPIADPSTSWIATVHQAPNGRIGLVVSDTEIEDYVLLVDSGGGVPEVCGYSAEWVLRSGVLDALHLFSRVGDGVPKKMAARAQ